MSASPTEIVAAIRSDIDQAADAILSAAERGLRALTAARGGDEASLDDLERTLCAILEACAFQDLTGQRLSSLEPLLAGVAGPAAGGDSLLNGPALPGQGLDQLAADGLMAERT